MFLGVEKNTTDAIAVHQALVVVGSREIKLSLMFQLFTWYLSINMVDNNKIVLLSSMFVHTTSLDNPI